MTDPVDHARAMLAANWNPDILAQYMAKNAADGDDSDEAMSTDDESDDSDVEIEDASFSLESVGDLDVAHPDDIASDDDAFSSDDEFGSDDILEKQRMRRELVLGRPTQALKEMHFKGLHALHYEYMAQLDEADAELCEITGKPYTKVERREPVLGLDKPIERGDDLDAYVLELRKRSNKEVSSEDSRKRLIEDLVVLAQDLFRKERVVKQLQQ